MRIISSISIAMLFFTIRAPSARAQTPININTSGSAVVFFDVGSGTGGEITTPSYDIFFASGPDTNYSVSTGPCSPDAQFLCESYVAGYGPGGSIDIYNSGATQLLFTGSFSGGTGSGSFPPGRAFASFSGGFTLNGIDGTGNLDASAASPFFSSGTVDFSTTVTPEPSTFVLALLGASMMFLKLRLMRST